MIPIAEPSFDEHEVENVVQAVRSGWISSKGKFILEFEERFAAYCGARYGVATSNGTVALHLALRALGIREGDEVIVPALTFIATANAVKYCNARPVFVDSQRDYWCIDPEILERSITARTKAIIPVHLYGHPCHMDRIVEIAKRRGLYVIEDAAEAHGAEFRGRKVGSFGEVGCFSFYGNKIITTGEGGMCLTDDASLAEKMRVLRDHGMRPERRYWHEDIGYNYRMTNMQAAVGVAQMDKLDKFVEKKRLMASWYSQRLSALERDGLIRLPRQMPWAKCVYWMYTIVLGEKCGPRVDEVIKRLRSGSPGIELSPFFTPIHLMPPYHTEGRLPIAEGLGENGIVLPSSVTLTEEEVDVICRKLSSLWL